MKPSSIRIIVYYTLICLIWGTTWFAIKIGLNGLPPFLGAAIRFVVASSIFGVIVSIKKTAIPINVKAVRIYLLLGLMGFSFPFAMVYWGQQYTTTGMSAVLFGVYPFLMALFSVLILRTERITKFKLVGMIIGFSGLIILFMKDIRFENQNAFFGAAAIVMSAGMQALNVVLIKKDAAEIPIFSLNFVSMSIGAIILFFLSIITESYSHIQIVPSTILSILYLGSCGSVVTFGIYFWLLKQIDTVILSLSALITPVIAVTTGVVFLGEHFSRNMALGTLFVLVGIFVANWEGIRKLKYKSENI